MYCVWKAYLEGTIQVTQSRISACDNYKVQVADPAKTVRLQKEQQLRKVMWVNVATPLSLVSPVVVPQLFGQLYKCLQGHASVRLLRLSI